MIRRIIRRMAGIPNRESAPIPKHEAEALEAEQILEATARDVAVTQTPAVKAHVRDVRTKITRKGGNGAMRYLFLTMVMAMLCAGCGLTPEQKARLEVVKAEYQEAFDASKDVAGKIARLTAEGIAITEQVMQARADVKAGGADPSLLEQATGILAALVSRREVIQSELSGLRELAGAIKEHLDAAKSERDALKKEGVADWNQIAYLLLSFLGGATSLKYGGKVLASGPGKLFG